MHNKLWHNDPDCLMARNYENPYERKIYGENICGIPWQDNFFGILDVEFNSWIKTLWMTSNMLLLSEVFDELPKDRQKLIDKCFTQLMRPVEYIDYYVDPEIVVLKTKINRNKNEPLIIGIFNMSDKTVKVEIPSKTVELKCWEFIEKFNDERFSGNGSLLSFPELMPRSSNIWVLKNM